MPAQDDLDLAARFAALSGTSSLVPLRPAAARANAVKDQHKFKTEFDDEARKAMFRHMDVKVA